jgi:excisionase family DNA binding protein
MRQFASLTEVFKAARDEVSNGLEKPLDMKGASEYLNVSVNTLRKWCSEKKIPYHKSGRGSTAKNYFFASELNAWLKSSYN